MQLLQDDLLEQTELSMEEMSDTRKHDDRNAMRSRPVERGRKWNHLIDLAVDHDRIRRHARQGLLLGRRADEHESTGAP